MKHFLLCIFLFFCFVLLKSQNEEQVRYLMITAPEFQDTLKLFADYKRELGFDVKIVNTKKTGKTPVSIKNYIQNQYDNVETRPTYVLLVGDVDKIPAYEGNPSGLKKNEPVSDLGYSLLEGDDYIADVFLGRFSVSNKQELKNIINKTIFMEKNMRLLQKNAKFVTGDDKTAKKLYMRNNFKKGHEYAIHNCFEPSEYQCERLYQPATDKALRALSDNPLFFLYAGHGSFNSIAGISFVIDKRNLPEATQTVFPVVFSFACKTGNFAHPSHVSMGEVFTRAENGAVAYFGASVTTTTDSDLVIEKKLFGKPLPLENTSLSAFINEAMKQFIKSHIVNKKVIRNLKSYNLLGDPSFNLKGVGDKYDNN